MEASDAIRRLASNKRGLSRRSAVKRQEKYGVNVLPDQAKRGVWRMLLDQFGDALVVVLIAAAIVSGVVGDPQDAMQYLAWFRNTAPNKRSRRYASLRRRTLVCSVTEPSV